MADDPKKKLKKKNVIEEIHETSDYNKDVYKKEGTAKNDSLVAATRAKLFGKDNIDQARAGNKAANETRAKLGVPAVRRYRQNADSNDGDKYSTPTQPRQDSYFRDKPLEKEMPRTNNTAFKNAMSFAGVKKKK